MGVALSTLFSLHSFASDPGQVRPYNTSHNRSVIDRSQVSEDYIAWIFSDKTSSDEVRQERYKIIAGLEKTDKINGGNNPKYLCVTVACLYKDVVMDLIEDPYKYYDEDISTYYCEIRKQFITLNHYYYSSFLPYHIKKLSVIIVNILSQ
ncbi:MAG: hypothetical protein BGO77_05925 [Caedibacter sp. 37-49]|nr:MAG: hypothetical protein BGO77_05925 [Caedibacter sp. 37-49]